MTTDGRTATIFLVERYLPAARLDDVAAAVTRVALACVVRRGTGLDLYYLHSTFLAAEDICFCVFQAPSAEAVLDVNEAARFGVDRITLGVRLDTSCTDVFPQT